MSTLKQRISDFAGRVVMGAPVKQIERPQRTSNPAPAVDEILDARNTAEAFAMRLIELATARDELDAAIEAERSAQSLDFASAIAAGQELPDLDVIASRARATLLRAKATLNLCDREVAAAQVAVLTLRRAATTNVEAATQAARDSVRKLIPEGVFPATAEAEIFKLSRPARECAAAHAEIDSLCGYSIPVAAHDLFGKRMQTPYRVEPLPSGKGHVTARDAFNPRHIAANIRTVMDTHLRSVGFFAGMSTEPASTTWTH